MPIWKRSVARSSPVGASPIAPDLNRATEGRLTIVRSMRGLALLLLAAACSSAPRSDYVPGGDALPSRPRSDYRRAVAKERARDAEGALAILDDLSVAYPLDLGIHLHRL